MATRTAIGMPLTGGATDKAGNSYERLWTVYSMLDVLDGSALSLRIEVPGDEGVGAEFVLRGNNTNSWHQAKRQRDSGPWTLAAMSAEGILGHCWKRIDVGDIFEFVSSTGAQELRELVERATHAESFAEFSEEFVAQKAQKERLNTLRKAWGAPDEERTYELLHQGLVKVHLIDEPLLIKLIEARLAALVDHEPAIASAVLAQLADASVHKSLDGVAIWDHLSNAGIARSPLAGDLGLAERLRESASGFVQRVGSLHIAGNRLPREEADRAFSLLSDSKRVVVTGSAGTGKSGVVSQAVERALAAGWKCLVISADRLPAVATPLELGQSLELPASPVKSLAGAASGAQALLVIDQLDATSSVSGRYPSGFTLVSDLIAEAAKHPNIHVLLACRSFDLQNDRSLRAISEDPLTQVVEVGLLAEDVVASVLHGAGKVVPKTEQTLSLLTVPLHLALYVQLAIADTPGIDTITSLTGLYERYWDLKRRECGSGGTDTWLEVIDLLADGMSRSSMLSVPTAALDDHPDQLNAMLSESVLETDGARVNFFHETFFDYCFARRFVGRGQSIVNLLNDDRQDLFRRSQVRQLLAYERDADPAGYLRDLEWLTTNAQVRAHIGALVVSITMAVLEPQDEEWVVMERLVRSNGVLANRVWTGLRQNPAWFPVLHKGDAWQRLLGDSDPAFVDRTLWVLAGATEKNGDEIAPILDLLPEDEQRTERVKGFLLAAQWGPSRRLFDRAKDAASARVLTLDDSSTWMLFRRVASENPAWAVELLATALEAAISAGQTNPLGESRRNGSGETTLTQLAALSPTEFAEQLVPLAVRIANLNPAHGPSDGWARDTVWPYRVYEAGFGLPSALMSGLESAIATTAKDQPTNADPLLAELRTAGTETAAFLLALGYTANPGRYASAAADWIANNPPALGLGYSDAPQWVSRLLVGEIAAHCSHHELSSLLESILRYEPDWELAPHAARFRGSAKLCLLNGIDSHLLNQAATRQLAELRRKFGRDDVGPPQGMTGGVVPPPISEDRASHMTDDQWIGATKRYDADTFGLRNGDLSGGAEELSRVMESATESEPDRFAQLALRFDETTHESYARAVLRGLESCVIDVEALTNVASHALTLSGETIPISVARLVARQAASTPAHDLVATLKRVAQDPRALSDRSMADYGLDAEGLNSTLGAVAEAAGRLLMHHPDLLPELEPLIRALSTDESLAVRAMTSLAFQVLLGHDAPLALELFDQSTHDTDCGLLGSSYVQRFLNRAIVTGHAGAIPEYLERCVDSDESELRSAAAVQLTVASYSDASLDRVVDQLLNSDEPTQQAVIGVFAHNFATAGRPDRAAAVLAEALDSASDVLRSEAQRCFFNIEDSTDPSRYGALLIKLARNPLSENTSVVLSSLEKLRAPLPPAALDLCEKATADAGSDLGDIRTGASAMSDSLVRLVLRLYAQFPSADMRVRCLDLIDSLVVVGAFGLDDALDLVER